MFEIITKNFKKYLKFKEILNRKVSIEYGKVSRKQIRIKKERSKLFKTV